MAGKTVREIALYGKGGSGKSFIASHLSAGLARLGYRVMQVGCDPNGDSTRSLRGGRAVRTVLDTLRREETTKTAELVVAGYEGVLCVETGAPPLGVIWPGRAILSAVQHLRDSGLVAELNPDFVIYDIPGDDAGGGFTIPVRNGMTEQVFTVLSPEFSSINAVNALYKSIRKHADGGGPLVGGLIANFIDAPYAREMVDEFSRQTTVEVLAYLPRSPLVAEAEAQGKTVIEAYPEAPETKTFTRMAAGIAEHGRSRVPYPLEATELSLLTAKWSARFLAMETAEGVGASI